MTESKLKWGHATATPGGLVEVPLSEEQHPEWVESFESVIRIFQGETRGQTWGEVTVIGTTIQVEGVPEGSEEALRDYLEDAVRQADEDVKRKTATVEEVRRRRQQHEAGSEAGARRMTERFRRF